MGAFRAAPAAALEIDLPLAVAIAAGVYVLTRILRRGRDRGREDQNDEADA